MEIGPTHKVRLVKCPKCRLLLPEPPGNLVYKCGGCNTVLQAKNRMNNVNGTTPGSRETEAAKMKEFNHVYEVGESSSSNQTMLPSSDKGSLDQKGGGDKNISRDHIYEVGESSSSSQKAILPSSDECSLDQNGGRGKNISRYHVFEVGECSSSSQKAVLGSSGECSLDQNKGGDQRISRDHVSDVGECSSPSEEVSDVGECSSPSEKVTLPSDKCSSDQSRGGDQEISRDDVFEGGESSRSSQIAKFPSSGECSLDQNSGGNQRISRDHVSEVGECSSSSQKATLRSSSECFLAQNEGEGQRISRNHVSEWGESSGPSEKANLPPSAKCSSDQSEGGVQEISRDCVSEDGESSRSSQIAKFPFSGKCSLNQNSGGDKIISGDLVSDSVESCSPCEMATLPSSGKCSLDQNGGGDLKISRDHVSEGGESSLNQIAILPSSGDCSLDQNGGGDLKISRDCSSENSEDVNSSDGDRNYESDHNESQVCIIRQPRVPNEFCLSNGDANHENEELSQFARTNSEVELNEMSSLQAGAKLAVEINSESDSTMRSSTVENMARRENNCTVTSHKPAVESFSSDILYSSPDEQSKQRQMNVNLSYERRDFFSPRSEVSSKTENYKPKFPRFRGRGSYEYDGSVSSYDGTDDQVPGQHMNLQNLPCDKITRHMNLQNFPRFRGRGSTGHGLPVSYGTRLQDDEFPSLLPFYQRGYPAGYESGSTSGSLQDGFHHSSSEQEKIKLLRMVNELQDQINKTCHVNGKANRSVSTGVTDKEKYIPPQYSGEIPEDEFFHDLNYHRYPERWRQVRNWSHQHKVSCIPFSGESTDGRQRMNHSCIHGYPQDSQCSVPLPPPFLSHNKGVRRFHFHPDHSCYNSYSSSPSSSHHFADSEFPIWHHDTKSDHQRDEDHHMKEKLHLVKRHLRPTAGGAPFITCYNCLNPLQLPADFIVFKRRFHLLRCGACTKVLKFSLERRTHIVPYTPEAAAAPPSQLNDYNDAVNRRNSVSSSRGNACSPADPVSCSDDYGLSHCQSYSTDGDPVILAPFHNGQGKADGINFSYDSSESMKKRPRFVRKQPVNKYKNPVETQPSSGPSSNKSRSKTVLSEIEDLPARKGSPLHRLMGYSSPSQVLRGSDDPSSSGHPHTTHNGT